MDEMFYLRHVEDYGMANMPGYRRISTRIGCIDSDADTAELHVKLLLRGITETIRAEGHSIWRDVQPVGRIEIFSDDYTDAAKYRLQDRGLVIFDTNGRPLLHVCNALIGYSGSGPSLTKAIFDELGVGQAIFDEIQATYAGTRSTNTPYYLVVQKVQDDIDRPDSFYWTWSSVRSSTWE